jgi:hypothetical protein
MIATETSLDNLTLNLQTEIHVRASLETTFEALLEELSSSLVTDKGVPMAMKLEAWPGGRWYRDLGDNNGHWWGNVQAIRRPTLLEIAGPLFMSYPVANNLQYRLSEQKDGTIITFHHTAMGLIIEDHRKGVSTGWAHIHDHVKQRAESMQAKAARR